MSTKTTVPLERTMQIVRWTHPHLTDEREIRGIAEDIRARVATFPPLTQEQIDKVRVLLRPESWGPTVHTGEREPG